MGAETGPVAAAHSAGGLGPAPAEPAAPTAPDAQYTIPPEIAALLGTLGQTPKAEDPDKVRAERIYYEVWGRLPPKNWWESVQHLSDFEIYEQELNGGKGVQRTQYWRDRGAEIANIISQAMGRRTG